LHAAGTTVKYTAWSLGAGLSGTLFDGGRGAATVDAAEARYRAAGSALRASVRAAAQDVENALAALASAEARIATTRLGEAAARRTLLATEAQWRAGTVSLFELEDARRLHATSQNSAIAAAQDSGRAWVALVRASGNAASVRETLTSDHVLLFANAFNAR
jgi:outer membrane protein TolC